MFRRLQGLSPRESGKWGVYAVVLLLPGSFIALPLWWIARPLYARILRRDRDEKHSARQS
jgi:hypothetical protein